MAAPLPHPRAFGVKVRKLREELGLSREKLCALSGISVKSLRHWENDNARIRFTSLQKLADALKVSQKELLLPASKKGTTRRAKGIRNRRQVIFYSKLVVFSLEEALQEASSERHHNNPPSDLVIDDDQYLQELRNLVAELKRLNALLESKPSAKTASSKPVIEVKKHLNKFLQKWAATVGVGAGVMTVGAMLALLHHLGVSDAMLDPILKKISLR